MEPVAQERRIIALATTAVGPEAAVAAIPARVHMAIDGVSIPGAREIAIVRVDNDTDNPPQPFGVNGHFLPRTSDMRYEMRVLFDLRKAADGNIAHARIVPRDDLHAVFADVLEVYGLNDVADDLPGALVGALNDFLTGKFTDQATPPFYHS